MSTKDSIEGYYRSQKHKFVQGVLKWHDWVQRKNKGGAVIIHGKGIAAEFRIQERIGLKLVFLTDYFGEEGEELQQQP
eukprot:378199-Ditylum_brightwellii.AAC.1